MGSGPSHIISQAAAEARLGAELERVRACFTSVCNTTDLEAGRMDQSQFCGSVFGSPFPLMIAKSLFRIFDVHEKGYLSWRDFCVGVAVFLHGTSEEKMRWIFQIYDVDQDGWVNRADMRTVLAVDFLARALPAQEIGKVIEATVEQAVPEGGNGLSVEDFFLWVQQHVAQSSLATWATSGAGVVSTSGGGDAKQDDGTKKNGGEVARVVDPTEQLVSTLRYVPKPLNVSSLEFLRRCGYDGPLDEERSACSRIVESDSKICHMIKAAFLGVRPKSVEQERQVIEWIVGNSQQILRGEDQDNKGKQERLEDSIDIVLIPSHSTPGGLAPEVDSVRFLLASAWYKQWTDSDGSKAIGPIDNSSLLVEGTFNVLRNNLQEGPDFVAVTPYVWGALRSWYGGGPAIQKPFIDDLDMVEVYPLNCKLYIRRTGRPPPTLLFCDEVTDISVSRKETIGSLRAVLCTKLNFRLFFTRLWKIDHDGHFSLLEKDADTVSQAGITSESNLCLEVAFSNGTWPLDEDNRVKTSGTKESKPADRVNGSLRVGLRNLGNTCYMNAAMQCLLASPVFCSPYFARSLHKKELCLANPIGFGGRVAWSFGEMVKAISTSTDDVYVPDAQKAQIGACNPDFAGLRQHDSQELLIWLLDALHEDLNRVAQKPYLEDPDDVDPNRTDEDLAAAFWANHKKRNDSIVVDLFHGQIKSILKCTTCNHTSRKFDVFSSLGLPLPVEDMRLIELLLHPNTFPAIPVRYGFRVPKNAKIIDLKRKLFELTGLKPRAVAIFSVWGSRHDRLFNNFDSVEAIRDNETVHAYSIQGYNPKLLMCNPPPRVELPMRVSDSDDDDDDLFGCFRGFGAESKRKKIKADKPKNADPKKDEKPEKKPEKKPESKAEDEDDDELTPAGADVQGSGKAALDSCFVQVVHRRVEKAPGNPLFNTMIPRLFASPLLLSFRVAEYNTESVYSAVWERVRHLISHDFELHRKPEDPQYPFRLCVVNHSGLSCAICHWTKFCVGCPLADDKLDINRHLVVSIDWDLQVLRMYFNNDTANRSEFHASVEENRRLQDYPVSLDECLELFGREEQVEDWYCRKCKEHRTATKTLSLFRLPLLLCVQLKRFQENRGRWEKTNKLVNFPLHGLHLGGNNNNNNNNNNNDNNSAGGNFSLYGVICHFGGIGGGHYTAFTRMPAEEQWYYCDDSRYRPIDEPNMVVSRAAYVLFFASGNVPVDEIIARVKDGPDLQPAQERSRCVIL